MVERTLDDASGLRPPDARPARRGGRREPEHVGGLELTSGCAEAREQAWRTLYDARFEATYRLVVCLGVHWTEAEDVVQRAFMTAYRRIHEIEHVDNPRAWLRGIAVRVVSDHRRWHQVRRLKRYLVRSTTHASHVAPSPPDEVLGAKRARRQVRLILDRMKAKLRDVLVMADLEQCPPREIAAALNIPVNTVRSRRRLARIEFLRLWREAAGEERADD